MQDGTRDKAAQARQDRLAEALRQNLKRRKSQSRARKASPAPQGMAGTPDGAGKDNENNDRDAETPSTGQE